jgi:hypothetical protein
MVERIASDGYRRDDDRQDGSAAPAAEPAREGSPSAALVPAQGSLEAPSRTSDPALRIRELEAQVRRLEWKLADAERRVEQSRSTISFRLGHALMQAFKSWRGLLALPRELLRIRREARLRRENSRKYSAARALGSKLRQVLLAPGLPASATIELRSSPITLVFDYHPSEGGFSVVGRVDGESRCALARIEYLDAQRNTILGDHPGLVHSPHVGAYRYLTTGDQPKPLFLVAPPKSCRHVRLGFQLSPGTRVARMSNVVSRVEQRRRGVGRAELLSRRRGTPVLPVEMTQLRLEAGRIGWPAPDSTAHVVGQRRKPTVLAVLDEFTTSCFAPDCILVRPRPDNWRALAEQYHPELVLIESAWKGNGGSWQYRVGSYANCPGDELAELVNFARYHRVPVVFWNKEDPVHHDKFLEAASMADVILTTDQEKIQDYVRETGNERVHAFPFAAQPALHWPRALAGRKARACFAGSWYGGRHATRANAMLWLLRAAKEHGLDIYDRNHGQEDFCFPHDLRDCVRGGLPYEQLCREYAAYRVFLNVNSVASSPTMFSRRVFELLASGTPVVSTYATGIERLLGADSVWFVDNPEEASVAVARLLEDDAEWRKRSLRGIRTVFSTHTYAHRLAELCRFAGVESCGAVEPRVLIAMDVETDADLDRLCSFRHTQTWQAFDLAAVDASGTRGAALRDRQVQSFRDSETLLRHVTGSERPEARYDLFGRIHAAAQYGPDYLMDLVNATRYAPSSDGWAKSRREDLFQVGSDFDEYGCVVRAEKLAVSEPSALKLLPIRVYCIDTSEFAREGCAP